MPRANGLSITHEDNPNSPDNTRPTISFSINALSRSTERSIASRSFSLPPRNDQPALETVARD